MILEKVLFWGSVPLGLFFIVVNLLVMNCYAIKTLCFLATGNLSLDAGPNEMLISSLDAIVGAIFTFLSLGFSCLAIYMLCREKFKQNKEPELKLYDYKTIRPHAEDEIRLEVPRSQDGSNGHLFS